MTTMTMKTDEQLVAAYQKRGDLLSLTQLRTRVSPMVQSRVNQFIAGPGHISRAAFNARADELVVDAAKSFDPKAGASFRTHLFNHLRRLDRYTKANANIAHVPEAKASMITTFQTQMKLLQDEKRRLPSDEELADHLSWPVHEVQRMHKVMRRELPESVVGGPHQMVGPPGIQNAVVDSLIDDIYQELSADERLVMDHILGHNGKKRTSSGNEIARATGFSPAKVSQIRTRVGLRIHSHLPGTTMVMP